MVSNIVLVHVFDFILLIIIIMTLFIQDAQVDKSILPWGPLLSIYTDMQYVYMHNMTLHSRELKMLQLKFGIQ